MRIESSVENVEQIARNTQFGCRHNTRHAGRNGRGQNAISAIYGTTRWREHMSHEY